MTGSARVEDRIFGSLGSARGQGFVRMEDRLDAEIDEVWSALTDPGRLARWLAEFDGDLRLDGDFRARFLTSGWEGTGRVDAFEPPRRLLLAMRDADPQPGQPDEGFTEITLAADGDRTIVVWEERGMPMNLLAAYGAGVQIQVEGLAAYLAGRDRVHSGRWDELLPAYQALAG
jgi:uncharacterized protein YndB with AHSA1/START domain